MGKIYPLSEKPSCFEATIKLIEKSFHYKKPNSFEIDFAPLIDKSNHQNCFIMLDENENVLAHIGAKEQIFTLGNRNFPITMLGGIAVDEARRGEGHFQTLLQDVLAEKRSDTTLFLLWSDLEKLYNKFGFHLCGHQYEYSLERKESHFIKTKYQDLVEAEQKEIQTLYKESFAKTYLTLNRNEADWKQIEKISSADLFIKKHNGRISHYYFMNKGQDLPEIIYEYGTKEDIGAFLSEIGAYGKVWMGKPLVETESVQYQFFMTPGDLRLFTEFVLAFTGNKVSIRNINVMKQEVYFDYNEELMALDLNDFLRGLFGPGTFEELELPAIFLSGLDSI